MSGNDRTPGPPFSPIAAEKTRDGYCQFKDCERETAYRICVKQFTEPILACVECSGLHFDREISQTLLRRSVGDKLRGLRTDN